MSIEPDFTRFQIALAGGRPDRVPLAEVGIAQRLKERFLGRPIVGLADEVEFWRAAGYDYVLLGRALGLQLFPGIHYGRPGRAWAAEGHGVITNRADMESYPWPDPAGADYTEFEQIDRYLPAGMKVIVYAAPIFQWAWMLAGFETFCIALKDDAEFISRLLSKIGAIRLAVLQNILARCASVGAVWMLDDLAYSEGVMIAPAALRKYVFPHLEAAAGLARDAGVPVIYHSDGAFWDVLEDILALGVQAIHPIEPKGMGSDLAMLKERLGRRVCLVGGIDLDVLIRGTPAAVASETRRVLSALAPGGGYIAGSSNTLTEDVPLENYRALLETVAEYKT